MSERPRRHDAAMGSHPLNLAVRAALELVALGILGLWGWMIGSGISAWLMAAAFPLLAAVAWGTFAVRGDPSRSGRAPVPVPGWLRLLLELSLFALAVYVLYRLDRPGWGLLLSVVVVVHYALSWDRVAWLLRGGAPP